METLTLSLVLFDKENVHTKVVCVCFVKSMSAFCEVNECVLRVLLSSYYHTNNSYNMSLTEEVGFIIQRLI